MSLHELNTADWVERLANALEVLAPTVRPQASDAHFVWFGRDSDLTDALSLLRAHPVLYAGLTGSGTSEGIRIVIPRGWGHVDLTTLVSSLVKLTIKTDGRSAASTLHRFLDLGERRKLKGHEITAFYGLKLKERLDLDDGAFLAPYDDIKADYGLPDDAEEAMPKSLPLRGEGITAFVRELTWGPALAPPTKNNESAFLKVKYRFPGDHEIVLNLLSAAIRRPLAARAKFIRVVKWMEDINPNFAFGWRSGFGHPTDGWWSEELLSEDSAATFQEMVRGWKDYRGKRDALDLAIRRLATSFSRTGRYGTEDRVLDSAIALEIMYDLDNPEITYKLATRAGSFLGTDAETRVEIFGKVRSLYRARSSLIHEGKAPKNSLDALDRASVDGPDLALRTLLELLRRGRAPNWDKLVMAGSDQ